MRSVCEIFFPDERVFGVDDVLPSCKPEKEAFDQVLKSVGAEPSQAVMFEDSMKNIRACKKLGMGTVLIQEKLDSDGGEAKLLSDTPDADDPSVDMVLQNIGQIREKLPGLWEKRFV